MLILASESPRRRELLGKIVEKFEVRSANIEEISAGTDPFYVPEHNARAKAQCVAEEYPEALVIGSDTVIVFEGKVIGKPRDIEDAKNILRSFSGKKHYVVTGVALRRLGAFPVDISYREVSAVQFKELDEEIINRYLSLVHVLDKAGAYALQEYGELIIQSSTGESENIIGLPLIKLKSILQTLQ